MLNENPFIISFMLTICLIYRNFYFSSNLIQCELDNFKLTRHFSFRQVKSILRNRYIYFLGLLFPTSQSPVTKVGAHYSRPFLYFSWTPKQRLLRYFLHVFSLSTNYYKLSHVQMSIYF